MLNRALKMTFWVMYDHLGKLLVANLLWSLPLAILGMFAAAAFLTGDPGIIAALGLPLTLVMSVVLLPVLSAGLAHMAKQLIDTRDGSVGDFFQGVRLYWKRAIGVGASFVAAGTVLTVSAWFYAMKLQHSVPWLGYLLSAVALWCLAFVALMAMYAPVALVQKRESVRGTLRLAAVLVLDNPLFSIGLALQFVVLAGLSFIPIVLVFLSGSLGIVLASSAYEILARKYARAQAAAETPAPGGAPNPVSRLNPLLVDDEQDDYLNRGFRDFLFPWKG